jgi:LCP family protein required for cell wall assembly
VTIYDMRRPGRRYSPPPKDPKEPKAPKSPGGKRPSRGKRRVQIAIRWTVIGLVVLLLLVGGYIFYNYQTFVSGITHIDAIPASNSQVTDQDGGDQNILLVGDDHRPANVDPALLAALHAGPDTGENNTDSMMVLHIPADGSRATLISFPRDSWVDVPGYGMNKLNSAFSLGSEKGGTAGGAQLLVRTIQNMTGLKIDHYMDVSLLGFYTIAQALGPLQVCLNAAVNDPYSGADFPAGVSELNAQQALAFVRQRHGLPGGDLDREVRQQYFLSVAAHKIISPGTLLNPGRLHDVLTAISSSIQTDPGLNLPALAFQLYQIGTSNIQSTTIPISGTPTIYVDGSELSIVKVDTAAMPAFIKGVIGPPSAYVKAQPADPKAVTVTVLNGSDTNGAAGTNTATLKAIGFKTGTPGNADTTTTTTIEYPSGMEAGAKALSQYAPGAQVVESSAVKGVTLVLGTDGIQATKPASGTPAPPPAASTGSGTTNAGSGSGDSGSTPKSFSSTTCIN